MLTLRKEKTKDREVGTHYHVFTSINYQIPLRILFLSLPTATISITMLDDNPALMEDINRKPDSDRTASGSSPASFPSHCPSGDGRLDNLVDSLI